MENFQQTLRLIEVLREEMRKLGSYDMLAGAILKESGIPVDRRKLHRLVLGEDVSLRIRELRALDTYLSPLGEGLAAKPIFERSSILAEISRSPGVVFLLGMLPRIKYERTDISHWDMRSLTQFRHDLNEFGQVRFDIEEVMYHENPIGSLQGLEKESWYSRLKTGRESVVCVGSPRVSPATEFMLAEMFGVEPFEEARAGDKQLPFYFLWPADRTNFRSRFCLDHAAIEHKDPEFAQRLETGNPKMMGLMVEDEIIRADAVGNRWKSYGVIVAQRRANGQIWLALAGLSGPSTYGVAKTVSEITRTLPYGKDSKQSPVCWAKVETEIEVNPHLPGDHRVINDIKLIDDLKVWSN
jgi:hypothetical protein